MKKIIFLFATVALLLSSCEGPRGPMGPQGPPGTPGTSGEGMNWEIINLTVYSGDWEPFYQNGLFLYYRYIFDLPELDEFIYDKGQYNTYLRRPEGNSEVQTELEVTDYIEDADGYRWERTISSDYMFERADGRIKSSVAFYVKFSDFYDGPDSRPETMKFRVVLMW